MSASMEDRGSLKATPDKEASRRSYALLLSDPRCFLIVKLDSDSLVSLSHNRY